jgi:alkylhydroperoxidase family enzyme
MFDMTQVQQLAPGPTELDRVYGLRPRYYELFMEDYNRSIARVDPVLVELCRLRMAKLLGSRLDLSLRYRPALEAGLTESKLRELSDYTRSPAYSERERRCLEFAEQFVIQSSNIGDQEVARVQEVLEPEVFIYFVKALSVMDQLQRGCVAFDVQPSATVPSKLPMFEAAPRTLQ